MNRYKHYFYCYLTILLINMLSFIIGQFFKIDWSGNREGGIAFFFVDPLIFIGYALLATEQFYIKRVYFKLPIILLIMKSLLIIVDTSIGMGWEIIYINSIAIFYPTSIISFLLSNLSNSIINYLNFILLIFIYEVIILKIFLPSPLKKSFLQ